MKVSALKKSAKQLDTQSAAFKYVDPDVRAGLVELSTEPLIMLERGDIEGAVKHIQWLRLDGDELQLFWSLFDSSQRSAMKKVWAK